MERPQNRDALYHCALEEFRKAYAEVKAGDPRHMALWDVADRFFALCKLDNTRRRLTHGEDLPQDQLIQDVTRIELVRNRIDMRSSEKPGYLTAIKEAEQNLRKLTINDISDNQGSEYNAAEYLQFYAYTIAQR